MKVVLDTNVLISGIFFPLGIPRQILKAWEQKKFDLVISPEIFDEYEGTVHDLQDKYPTANAAEFLDLIITHSQMCYPPKLPRTICEDPDDDMFIACALNSNTKIIISGDKLLQKVSGYQNIDVLTARQFFSRYLQ